MVKLKNIRKNKNIIECDILPEDSKEVGHLSVQIDSGEIKEYSLPVGYEWCRNHINHAQKVLLNFVRDNNIQKEKLVMWY